MPMRGLTHDEHLQTFADAGHTVRGVVPAVWSPRRWLARTPLPYEERDGAVVVLHPRYLWLPRFLRGAALERRLFARAAARVVAAPDVVLAHSATLPGGLIGRVRGAVFVIALWDHELYELAPHSRSARAAMAWALRRADCVVYVSEALRREGVRVAGPHRSVVIPTGIKAYQDLTAIWPEHFTVCTVARLIPRKRVDQVIRAFARIAADRSDARLVIVGDGPERPALQRLVQTLGMQRRVELTGALDARATRERMAHASVMALPSVRESLAGAYLEAMSLGVPALGTRGEGIEEHIEHGVNGVLVPPDNEAALHAELRALADDPARARQIGEAGRRRFQAGGFTWRASAKSYLALFDELLKERATHTT